MSVSSQLTPSMTYRQDALGPDTECKMDPRYARSSIDVEKISLQECNVPDAAAADTALHRGLQARHITMIAIGGALGTGLIIGTGKALAQAGPGPLLICFAFIGGLVFMIMAALGEMVSWLPLSSGFTGYTTRYCHPSLGFAFGWT